MPHLSRLAKQVTSLPPKWSRKVFSVQGLREGDLGSCLENPGRPKGNGPILRLARGRRKHITRGDQDMAKATAQSMNLFVPKSGFYQGSMFPSCTRPVGCESQLGNCKHCFACPCDEPVTHPTGHFGSLKYRHTRPWNHLKSQKWLVDMNPTQMMFTKGFLLNIHTPICRNWP